jgi:type VI secretion system Hcp family effector
MTKRARTLLLTGIAMAVLTLGVQTASADSAVAVVVGNIQGQIQGDDTSKVGAGGISIQAVQHSISAPFDSATGQLIGKRRHSPLYFVKKPDKSSPKLLMALALNENLTVDVKFFRTVSTGAVVHYHTFKLINAKVIEVSTAGSTDATGGVVENVGFTYQKIEVTDHVNKITVVDDWGTILP